MTLFFSLGVALSTGEHGDMLQDTTDDGGAKAKIRYGTDTKEGVAVIPAYNEEKHVSRVVEDVFETDLVSEVIVVDDASEDDTAERAEEAGALVLRNEVNRRNGGAIKRGYAKALELGPDIIYRLDADGQHNPKNLSRFYEAMTQTDCEYVLGNRFADREYAGVMPPDRLIGNKIVSLMTSLRTRSAISDPSCGFRAIDPSYVRRIPYSQFSDNFQIDIQEIIAIKQLGGKLQQVAVDCIYSDEESYLSYLDGVKILLSNLQRLNPHSQSVGAFDPDGSDE